MSGAYVVMAIASQIIGCPDIKVCELYAGREAAFKRAIELSKMVVIPFNSDYCIEDPHEENYNNSPRWIFLDVNEHLVVVEFHNIQIQDVSQNADFWQQCGHIHSLYPSLKNCTPLSTRLDNPTDRSLPAGWDYNNKPITMETLINNPYCAVLPDDLTQAQQKALVIARIRKRPHFVSKNLFSRDEALDHIKFNTSHAQQIIDQELQWLTDYIISLS